jgi:hypothetical protein
MECVDEMLVLTYSIMTRIREFDRPGVNRDDCQESTLKEAMTLSLGVMGMECEVDQSAPPSADVKNVWSFTFTPT